MTPTTKLQQIQSFDNIDRVLANEERFKLKLGTGRNAFASVRAGDLIGQITGVGSAAGAGAGAAFATSAPTTFWGTIAASLGLASTPIGWVVGAAAASGGLYYGVSRLFKIYSSNRVHEVPKFLNTGLDVLASTTFDLLGSLSLKVAAIDGRIDPTERDAINEYFSEEWGYDPHYLQNAMDLLEQNIGNSRLSDMADSLAAFSRENPDCDFQAMRKELRMLLTEIAEADGRLDEREEMAIDRIESALSERNSLASSTGRALLGTASGAASATTATARTVGRTATSVAAGAADAAASLTKSATRFIGSRIRTRK